MGDEEARIREGHLAYRHVHENHTYRHRMDEVFRRVGLEPPVSEGPSVSVLMPTMRPENVATVPRQLQEADVPGQGAGPHPEQCGVRSRLHTKGSQAHPQRAGAPRGRAHDPGTLSEPRRGGGVRQGTSPRWTTTTITGSGTCRTAFSRPRSRTPRSSGRGLFFVILRSHRYYGLERKYAGAHVHVLHNNGRYSVHPIRHRKGYLVRLHFTKGRHELPARRSTGRMPDILGGSLQPRASAGTTVVQSFRPDSGR